jgi:hypothetical protein
MARLLRPQATALANQRSEATAPGAPPSEEFGDEEAQSSLVRLRIAPRRESANFVAWAQEQITATDHVVVSEEVRLLENRLIAALSAHDLAQALMLANAIVYQHANHEVAKRIKARCSQQLRGAPLAFPRHDAIPRMRVPWHELAGRNLSRRAAFMLSCVDGVSTVEQLIDVSALAPLLAYDTLDNLLRDGIIELT